MKRLVQCLARGRSPISIVAPQLGFSGNMYAYGPYILRNSLASYCIIL